VSVDVRILIALSFLTFRWLYWTYYYRHL